MVRALRRAGHFISLGEPLVEIIRADRLDRECENTLRSAFIIGSSRTAEQDLEHPLGQLVEIAVRSLSAGINDPTTANNCVDWITASLARIAQTRLPPAEHHDRHGVLRVLLDVPSFGGIIETAFNQIRQYGQGSVPVTLRMLEAIGRIGWVATPHQRGALREQADMLLRQSEDFQHAHDREAAAERHRDACRNLAEEPASSSEQGVQQTAGVTAPTRSAGCGP